MTLKARFVKKKIDIIKIPYRWHINYSNRFLIHSVSMLAHVGSVPNTISTWLKIRIECFQSYVQPFIVLVLFALVLKPLRSFTSSMLRCSTFQLTPLLGYRQVASGCEPGNGRSFWRASWQHYAFSRCFQKYSQQKQRNCRISDGQVISCGILHEF